MLLASFLFIFTLGTAVSAESLDSTKQLNETAIHEFATIRAWMQNDFQVNSASQLPFQDDSPTCVVLRHHGVILGYGSAMKFTSAAAIAVKSASEQSIFLMKITDQLKTEIIDSISIELEVGQQPIPSPHKNIDRFEYSFNRGMHGIAVRRGASWNIKMQAELRVSPFRTVSNIVESLCINLGVHPTIAFSHQLPPDDDVTLYSIPSKSYLQTHAGAEIAELIRGDELVRNETISTSHLTKLADSLASHLITSMGPNGKMIGGYQPETNTLKPMFATHFVQALSATALKQYSQLNHITHGLDALHSANTIVESIAADFRKNKKIDTESASLLILLLLHSEDGNNQLMQQLLHACESKVLRAEKNYVSSTDTPPKAFELSLVTAALIELGIARDDEALLMRGEHLCTLCFTDIPLESRASLIPWIISPIIKLQELGNTKFDDSLLELLRLALVSQVLSENDQDLIGGFMLSTDLGNIVDARGLRMLPMLAKICDSSATHKTVAFKSLITATRFVEQLTTRENKSNRYESPAMAIGGVRKSPWNAEMPTEATAMALLGITDAINTILHIESSVK